MKTVAFWLSTLCLFGVAVALLVAMFNALDGSSLMLCVGCQESLDKAQAAFEAKEKPKHYDFDAWRAAGDLKCQNAPTLRICRANPVVSTEYGGVRDFMSFACSSIECAWVDP